MFSIAFISSLHFVASRSGQMNMVKIVQYRRWVDRYSRGRSARTAHSNNCALLLNYCYYMVIERDETDVGRYGSMCMSCVECENHLVSNRGDNIESIFSQANGNISIHLAKRVKLWTNCDAAMQTEIYLYLWICSFIIQLNWILIKIKMQRYHIRRWNVNGWRMRIGIIGEIGQFDWQ